MPSLTILPYPSLVDAFAPSESIQQRRISTINGKYNTTPILDTDDFGSRIVSLERWGRTVG